MQCIKPVRIYPQNKRGETNPNFPDGLDVPCGQCLQCRIARRREWVLRLWHENSYHESSAFLTLTYDDNNIPENASLRRRDIQLFHKRLRRSLDGRKIRYFTVGEYGDLSSRPHYHGIYFGLSLNQDDKERVMDSWPFCDWSIPIIRNKSFGVVEPDSIRYVAQYIDKKFTGDLAEEEYQNKGREPVFKFSSQGIGEQFALDNEKQIIENKYITMNGVKYSVPRYYFKKLNVDVMDMIAYSQEKEIENCGKISNIYLPEDDFYKIAPHRFKNYKEVMQSKTLLKDKSLRKKGEMFARSKM